MATAEAAAARRQSGDLRNYILVTVAYWADTLTDGAIRMLVLFYFFQRGYTPFQVASLFIFYEVFGVVTNLVGGWLAARLGLKATLFGGLATQVLALSMLGLVPEPWLTVPYVMAAQALSGIAKDLTKMSSKSAVKLSERAQDRWRHGQGCDCTDSGDRGGRLVPAGAPAVPL
jgi:MFS-type transporter involved in bile tolerance (Atg22 family)